MVRVTSWDWHRTCCQVLAQSKQDSDRRQADFSLEGAANIPHRSSLALSSPFLPLIKTFGSFPSLDEGNKENHLLGKKLDVGPLTLRSSMPDFSELLVFHGLLHPSQKGI